jgi:hypothetical protein
VQDCVPSRTHPFVFEDARLFEDLVPFPGRKTGFWGCNRCYARRLARHCFHTSTPTAKRARLPLPRGASTLTRSLAASTAAVECPPDKLPCPLPSPAPHAIRLVCQGVERTAGSRGQRCLHGRAQRALRREAPAGMVAGKGMFGMRQDQWLPMEGIVQDAGLRERELY